MKMNKVLAFMLAAAMVISTIPMNVVAAETELKSMEEITEEQETKLPELEESEQWTETQVSTEMQVETEETASVDELEDDSETEELSFVEETEIEEETEKLTVIGETEESEVIEYESETGSLEEAQVMFDKEETEEEVLLTKKQKGETEETTGSIEYGTLIETGDCGATEADNLVWSVYGSEGNYADTLVISGSGKMKDYVRGLSGEQVSPWQQYRYDLKRLVLEEGITYIGDFAFYFFGGLTGNLEIPESVQQIGSNAFVWCDGFNGNLILHEGLLGIGDKAFSRCDGLTGNLEIPESVQRIGADAFSWCDGFNGNLILHEGLLSIGNSAFSYCTGLKGNLIIPDTVKTIGSMAFTDCSGFNGRLRLSDKLTKIDMKIFMGCKNLCGEVEIPNNISAIYINAFWDCEKIERIVIKNKKCGLSTSSLPYSTTIVGFKNSTAKTYAVQHGNPFEEYICTHMWDKGVVTKSPTCATTGEKTYTCIVCGTTKNEEISALGHIWNTESTVDIEATCIKVGSQSIHCSVCNAVKKESDSVIPAKGHKWNTGTVTLKATCTAKGEITHVCKMCRRKKTVPIPKKAHRFTKWEKEKSATVFSAEIHSRQCLDCKKKYEKSVGNKIQPTLKVNATLIKLKTKQSISAFYVSGMANGDSVKTWKSSNKKIATITGNPDGTCTIAAGNKTGKAVITIKLASGMTKTITVKVQKSLVKCSSIKGIPQQLTLTKKKSYRLNPVIAPFGCEQEVNYASSNNKVATVGKKGKITAKKKGTVKITVTVGKKKVTCTVKVK